MAASCCSSLRIRSPALSPSRKAVTSLSLVSLMMVSGTLVPFSATTFLIPTFIRRMTSALPSTTINEPLSTSGPAGSFSGPYSIRSTPRREDATSLTTSSVLGDDSTTHLRRMSFALVSMAFRFSSRTSSTFSRVILASQGPILSTLSIAAAIIAVETLSKLDGRSEEHTSELQSRPHLVCRLLLEKKKNTTHSQLSALKAVLSLSVAHPVATEQRKMRRHAMCTRFSYHRCLSVSFVLVHEVLYSIH